MISFDKRIFTHFDYVQIFLILPIIVVSHVLISEANEALAFKQYIYFSIGFVCFLFFFLVPVRKIDWLIPTFYWINIILLLSVDFFGVSKLGAQRWLEIPIINFTIQPSEIMKPAFLLMLAYKIKQTPPEVNGYGVVDFLKLSFIILLPFVLILKEPDLGTALILFLTGFAILFIVGVNKKIWIFLSGIILALSPLIYENLHDYQKKRIIDFISEEPSYHVKQSIIAIGNGGLTGKTEEEATQTHFKFLPISTSDFIFAFLLERYGFIGAGCIMFLYISLIFHLLLWSYKLKNDYFAIVMTCGVGILISIYSLVNISMTIGFAPVVGVPLPFFSYGGTSFITFMCFFGILQNLLTFRFDMTNRMFRLNFN